MSAPLRIALLLAALVVVGGVAGWIATGKAMFAVFLLSGLGAALSALAIGRGTKSREGTP